KLLAARQGDELVELLPALQIVFHLGDQLLDFFVGAHRLKNQSSGVELNECLDVRKIIAPPRNSRAVICRLAKLRVNSDSVICALRASRNRRKTWLLISCSNSAGQLEEMVVANTRQFRSTVMLPVGSNCSAGPGLENRLRSPMMRSVVCFARST